MVSLEHGEFRPRELSAPDADKGNLSSPQEIENPQQNFVPNAPDIKQSFSSTADIPSFSQDSSLSPSSIVTEDFSQTSLLPILSPTPEASPEASDGSNRQPPAMDRGYDLEDSFHPNRVTDLHDAIPIWAYRRYRYLKQKGMWPEDEEQERQLVRQIFQEEAGKLGLVWEWPPPSKGTP
jgi:hypothetical protein